MGVIDWFKSEPEVIEENIDIEPISIKDVEDVVKIINEARKVNELNLYFELILYLKIGEFYVDSVSLKDIKILKKTKSEPDRIIISHCNALLSTDTTIRLEDILKISFKLEL